MTGAFSGAYDDPSEKTQPDNDVSPAAPFVRARDYKRSMALRWHHCRNLSPAFANEGAPAMGGLSCCLWP